MEGDWDGLILCQYNRYVLSWRPKGFSDEKSRIHKRLRLSTEHIWEFWECFQKESGLPVLGKRNRKGLGTRVILGYSVYSLSAMKLINEQ